MEPAIPLHSAGSTQQFYSDAPKGGSFEGFTADGAIVRSLVDLTMMGIGYYLDVADPDTAIQTVLEALTAAKSRVSDWEYLVETPTILVSSYPPLLSRDGSPRVRQGEQYRSLLSTVPLTLHLVGGPVTLIGREPYHSQHITLGTGPVSPNQRWSGRLNAIEIEQRDWGTGPERKGLKRETVAVTAHRWPQTVRDADQPVELFGGHKVPTAKEGDGFVYQQIFTELESLLEKGNVAIGVTGLPGKGKTQVYLHCQSQKPRYACKPLLRYTDWGDILAELFKEVEQHRDERPIIVIHDQAGRPVPGRSQSSSREDIEQSLEDIAASRKNRIIYLLAYSARRPKLPLGFVPYELPPLDAEMMGSLVDRYSSRLPIKKAHLNLLTGGYLGFTLSLLEQVKTIIEDEWAGARPIEADTSWTLIRTALAESTELEQVTSRFFEVMNEEAGGRELADFLLLEFSGRLAAHGVTERLLDPIVFTEDQVATRLANSVPPPRPKDIHAAAEAFVRAKLLQPVANSSYRLRELIPFLIGTLGTTPTVSPAEVAACGSPSCSESAGKLFISYSSRDREQVRPIVGLLRNQGNAVWWDQDLVPGTSWSNELENQLKESACILVFLTNSAWEDGSFVRNEALYSPHKVIPVLLAEGAPVPLPFIDTQHASLAGWGGDISAPPWTALITGIRAKMKAAHEAAA